MAEYIEVTPDGILFGVKNATTRQYLRVRANDLEQAKAATEWGRDILYTLQLEVKKSPMSEKAKRILCERSELLKSIRGPKRSKSVAPESAGITSEEEKAMSELMIPKGMEFKGRVEPLPGVELYDTAKAKAKDWVKFFTKVRDGKGKVLGMLGFEFKGDRDHYKGEIKKAKIAARVPTEPRPSKAMKAAPKTKVVKKPKAKKDNKKKSTSNGGLPFSKEKQLGEVEEKAA